MIIREGMVPILVMTAVAVGVEVKIGLPWSLGPWIIALWLVWIYRVSVIRVVADPLGILSPVSGKIISHETETDPFRNCPVIRLRVRMTPPGVTALRYPIEGQVQEVYLRRGVLGAELQATVGNESPDCYAQSLRTDEGEEVLFAISSHWPVSRCSLERAPGERAGQGQLAGFFYFGSFLDVLIPEDSLVQVAVGDRVKAGETQLARLFR